MHIHTEYCRVHPFFYSFFLLLYLYSTYRPILSKKKKKTRPLPGGWGGGVGKWKGGAGNKIDKKGKWGWGIPYLNASPPSGGRGEGLVLHIKLIM